MKRHQRLIYFNLVLISLFLIVSCQVLQPELKTEAPVSTLRLGFSNWPGCAVWQIASEQGIFEKNNLNVDLQFSDYTTGFTNFASGQLDANCHTLYDTIYLLGTDSQVDQVIVALTDWSTGGDQIIAASGIKSIRELKGKKVAFESGSVGNFLLLLALEKYGLKLSDIKAVNQDLITNVALFVEEEVDAIITYIPFVKEAMNRPGSQIILTSKDFPGAISDHLVVTRKFMETNPQVVQALVDTWFDTVEFMQKNPDRSRQIIAYTSGLTIQDLKKYESQIAIKGLSENLTAFERAETLTSLPYAAEKIYQFLQKNKLMTKSVNIEQILDDSFVRNKN
ncbi:MAG TPA: aliphatic sulfonates ABC transporter substrate-binding protein [Planktothrix sp. UBA8407]|jgi:ABC transporter, substrate-binding protein, aliphatic sulfonates family|nr:aliphatic sulfonates ABC transporter substrate-binding protein [Planktothrix sp. UBA8402]HAO13417.1 aliphatic sulfonates ABC transporter substrate-binding protein [Planktothrix sp. UBA8407]HBK24651.1 aliphatic sulfonates ABC transporter substrate-binding protein [Planktothrix sp. UBA10369]